MFTPSAAGGRPSSASTTSPAGSNPSVPLQSSASHNSIFTLSSSSHSRQPSHGDLHLHSQQQQSASPMSLQKMHTIQHILNEPEMHVRQHPID